MRNRQHVSTGRFRLLAAAAVVALAFVLMLAPVGTSGAAEPGRIPAGAVLRISVPEAVGGKTVIGQLTVDRVTDAGWVAAYGCDNGPPVAADGTVARSDLNFDAHASPVASNRLIVQADDNGDVCFLTSRAAAIVVDVNAVTFDTGVNSFPNRRVDTRTTPTPRVPAGGVLRVAVPEAVGGKTVVGQLTVDRVTEAGWVAAYGCDDGPPIGADGTVARSDLNFDAHTSPVASNRLIVQADADGDVCFLTYRPASLIVDLNGVADTGITSFHNRRVDTRTTPTPRVPAGGVLRVAVPEAVGGKTVVGQLTVDRVTEAGWVAAYGCDDGPPIGADGTVTRSDLNFDAHASPVASNRLIVQADADGDVCFLTYRAASLIVDVNAVSGAGINSFANRRTDTRSDTLPAGSVTTGVGVPVFAPFTPLPPVAGRAALTGLPADETVTDRPILAVKIDNYGPARPQWALDQADALIEENVEGISRFVALFHSQVPDVLGPVRSARTGDLDLLAAMNRPVFAYSGANAGVDAWLGSAAWAGVLVDYSAQRNGCFARTAERPGPHNLLLDPACALGRAPTAGPAGPLWTTDAAWAVHVHPGVVADSAFSVAMDGVSIGWQWDPAAGRYLRWQDGVPHLAASGVQLTADNVVELGTTYVPSPVDARSPNAITVGTGDAVVHRDGAAIPVVWTRAAPDQPFTFGDAATGAPVPLDTGVTVVELERV